MIGVQTLYTSGIKPTKAYARLWALSVLSVHAWNKDIYLVTDDTGSKWANEIGLPYKHIRLYDFNREAPSWSFNKVEGIELASRTAHEFFHWDNDCIMFKDLPSHIINAPVAAQCPEPMGYYREGDYLLRFKGIPFAQEAMAYNMGLFIVNDKSFARHYCSVVQDVAWQNEKVLREMGHRGACILEQLVMGAVAKERGVEVSTLLPSLYGCDKQAFDLGFVHLFGLFKGQQHWIDRVSERLKSMDQKMWKRIEKSSIFSPAPIVVSASNLPGSIV